MPFLLGNKGCKKENYNPHPAVEKGVACKDCHDDGRTKETKPTWHDVIWQTEHGKNIKKLGFDIGNNCLLCHTESTCSNCHAINAPKDHNNFFRLKGHGLAMGLDRSKCSTCHRTDFCRRCHSQTRPQDHAAAFGAPLNRHCLSCHYPINSAGAQRCVVCHTGTPSHASAPKQPSNALHLPGANCRSCHIPLRHPDNGMNCIVCHTK
jgi:hypothetical protein